MIPYRVPFPFVNSRPKNLQKLSESGSKPSFPFLARARDTFLRQLPRDQWRGHRAALARWVGGGVTQARLLATPHPHPIPAPWGATPSPSLPRQESASPSLALTLRQFCLPPPTEARQPPAGWEEAVPRTLLSRGPPSLGRSGRPGRTKPPADFCGSMSDRSEVV